MKSLVTLIIFLNLSIVAYATTEIEMIAISHMIEVSEKETYIDADSVSKILDKYEEYTYNNFNFKVDKELMKERTKKYGQYIGIVAPAIIELDTALALGNRDLANMYVSIINKFDPKYGKSLSEKFNLSNNLFNDEAHMETRGTLSSRHQLNDSSYRDEGIDQGDRAFTRRGRRGVISLSQVSRENRYIRGEGRSQGHLSEESIPVGPLFNDARSKNQFSIRSIGISCSSGCATGSGVGTAVGGTIGGVGAGLSSGGAAVIPGAIVGAKTGRDFGCMAGCIGGIVNDFIADDHISDSEDIAEDVSDESSPVEEPADEEVVPVTESVKDDDEEPQVDYDNDDRVINPDILGNDRVINPDRIGVSRVVSSDVEGSENDGLLQFGLSQIRSREARTSISMNPSLINVTNNNF